MRSSRSREAFAAFAAAQLREDELRPAVPIDAVVFGHELTLDLCEELERLAPFGLGNPGVTLLAPDCELAELAAVGDGKHLKLAVVANRVRSGAIAFGQAGQLDRLRSPGRYDVAFRLAANRWNGTVAPQLVVRRIFDTPGRLRSAARPSRPRMARRQGRVEPRGAAIFGELGLDGDPRRKRPLVESATFRALADGTTPEELPQAA